ncbi:nucleotidyltransferase family protein [Streptomyces cellostaticus]|uniref:nucleotidyltransferase family protein n=1 Tax=Streptomyces cellostaticus TaxID=67285 RepID=UPI002027594A|nr:nucleotidyltransferase family protein [Streptomyces cellostaticus]
MRLEIGGTHGRPEFDLLLHLSRVNLTADAVAHCRHILAAHQEDFDWGFFIDQAGRHKVIPLVGKHIVTHRLLHRQADVPVIPYHWLFDSVYFANSRRNEALAQEFGKVFFALNEARICYAIRKGPVIVESLYQDPGLRRMYDLDILVDQPSATRICRVLEQCGYVQGRVSLDGKNIEPFTRQTQVFWGLHVNNQLPYVKLSRDPAVDVFPIDVCLDISQKITQSKLSVPDILGRRKPLELCGVPSFAMSPEDQFIDLCLHLRKEATGRYYIEAGTDLQILKFLDISLLCSYTTKCGGWDDILRQVRATATTESVYYAMHYTALLYPDSVPREILDALQPSDCQFLEEYGGVDGSIGRWSQPFTERLFARDRQQWIDGTSSVPRV